MNKKIKRLDELLKATDTKAEFNIIEDLESLERAYGMLKPKQYRQKMQTLIRKYKESELTEVRAALLEKCRQGDIQAIRLYADYFKPAETTAQDDGLVDVLGKSAKELFNNE